MNIDSQINSFADERVGLVFICLDEDSRQCIACGRTFSRQDSYEHSKTLCYQPAPRMN